MAWKLRFVLLLGCILGLYPLYAETVVKGKITDEEGNPLYQVSVIEAGTGNGVLSDTNGIYQIVVPSDRKTFIKATSVGYEPGVFTVKNDRGATVQLDILLPRLYSFITTVV